MARNDRSQSLPFVARTGRAAIAAVVLLLAPLPIAGAMDIESIQINAGIGGIDGFPEIDPYYLDVTVEGSGIAGVVVTSPAGCSAPLLQVAEDTFWIEFDEYESLLEMTLDPCLGFGVFEFELAGVSGESDGVILSFDLGTSEPFIDYGEVLYPAHLDFDIPLDPTLEWTCSGTCDDKEGWDLQVVRDSDGSWDHSGVLAATARLWTPGPLAPNTAYWFWVHLVDLHGGTPGPTTTDEGDGFSYAPTWETLNRTLFVTLENPVLFVERARLTWTVLSVATGYDVIRGDLATLRSSGGDFITATVECLAENHPLPSLNYTLEPGEGQGYWYLVRGVDAVGGLTYESLYSSQIDTRDDEIAMAAGACF